MENPDKPHKARKRGRPQKRPEIEIVGEVPRVDTGPPLEANYEAIERRMVWIAEQHMKGDLSDDAHAEQLKACRGLLASLKQRSGENELLRWEQVVADLKAERMAREQREALDREHRGGQPVFNGDPLAPKH